MSLPIPVQTISVQLDAVEALAGELAALAAELADDAGLCRSTAASLTAALGGEEGWTAGAAAIAWASLEGFVAARTGALAATLVDAVAAYRAEDAVLSERLGSGRLDAVPVPR
jgi:hypothetical protein